MAKRPLPKAARTERKRRGPERKPAGKARSAPDSLQPLHVKPVVHEPLPGPAADAVASYQAAMTALQKHDYRRAAEEFHSLLNNFPAERALLDRARVYLDLCDRELGRKTRQPESTEEEITSATAALNDGDEGRAERLARAVLSGDPRHEIALYLMAVIETRRGALDSAISFLDQAAAVNPEVRAQARLDTDFEPLRDLPEFQELTDLLQDGPGGRRAKRPRAER